MAIGSGNGVKSARDLYLTGSGPGIGALAQRLYHDFVSPGAFPRPQSDQDPRKDPGGDVRGPVSLRGQNQTHQEDIGHRT